MRRRIIFVALLALPVALAACSELSSAPRRDTGDSCTTIDGKSGYITSDGRCEQS